MTGYRVPRSRSGRSCVWRLIGDDAGITLIELIVGLGISAFVLAFVGTAVYQFYKVTGWGNGRMVLASDLQTAELWLGRDSVQAASFVAESPPNYGHFVIPTSTDDRLVRYSYDPAAQAITRTELTSGDTVSVARDIANQSDVAFSLAGQRLSVSLTANRGGMTDTVDLKFTLRVP
jgi:hypothetical protein